MAIENASAWAAFSRAVVAARSTTLRGLFAGDSSRLGRWTITSADISLDLSRQFITDDVFDAFIALYAERDVASHIDDMLKGRVVNTTENRAVTHGRSRRAPREHLRRAFDLSRSIRSGALHGATGLPFTHVINIGIGGSDLGPALVARALADYCDGPEVSFVSNIDASDLDDVVSRADPATTLCVISSKTMTTIETMTNAERARAWIAEAVGTEAATSHFVAITAAPEVASAWGVGRDRILEIDESIGGRFSVSSAMGFPAMVAVGPTHFEAFLDGMQAMDDNLCSASVEKNLSALHALTVLANATALHLQSHAIVPYAHRLARLPGYLQQVVMESNGKSVDLDGDAVGSTSPVVWGSTGTNGQHAFFQMLHQGTFVVPVDFIVVESAHGAGTDPVRDHAQEVLNVNARAQADALAFGRTLEETIASGVSAGDAPHRVFTGNRPSTTITLSELTPKRLGALLALYENSVAVQGWLWGINSFDQYGVELGKSVALRLLQEKP